MLESTHKSKKNMQRSNPELFYRSSNEFLLAALTPATEYVLTRYATRPALQALALRRGGTTVMLNDEQ